eukprot:COSAG04_NODE_27896_length_279_cov_0.577778_1_plen_93_part_11
MVFQIAPEEIEAEVGTWDPERRVIAHYYQVFDQHKTEMKLSVRSDGLRLVSPDGERVISIQSLRSWQTAGDTVSLTISSDSGGPEQMDLVSSA